VVYGLRYHFTFAAVPIVISGVNRRRANLVIIIVINFCVERISQASPPIVCGPNIIVLDVTTTSAVDQNCSAIVTTGQSEGLAREVIIVNVVWISAIRAWSVNHQHLGRVSLPGCANIASYVVVLNWLRF